MLRLKARTGPEWVERAVAHLDEVMIDHAHCEKKAASMALTLMFRYPHHAPLLRPLSALAREELEHFDLVLDHLDARGVRFDRIGTGGYAAQLLKVVRTAEPLRLLDTLLCCAVIEARSCERMQLLAEALVDVEPEVSAMYAGLLRSEARHHALYVELADALFDKETVRARLDEVTAHEAAVIADLPPMARMHA